MQLILLCICRVVVKLYRCTSYSLISCTNTLKKRLKVMPLAFCQKPFSWLHVLLIVFSYSLVDDFFIGTSHYKLTALDGTCFKPFDSIFFIKFYPCVYCCDYYIKHFNYFWSRFTSWLQQHGFVSNTMVVNRTIIQFKTISFT